MRTWHYTVNPVENKGHYWLEEGRWYIFLIQWVVVRIRDLIPEISLPPLPWRGGENLRERYGELDALFHCLVCDPIYEWADNKIDSIPLKADYEEVRNRFYKKNKNALLEQEEDEPEENENIRDINIEVAEVLGVSSGYSLGWPSAVVKDINGHIWEIPEDKNIDGLSERRIISRYDIHPGMKLRLTILEEEREIEQSVLDALILDD